MELWSAQIAGLFSFLLVILGTIEWLWWKPKKFEKHLRSQGIKGTPYKLLFGDLRQMDQLSKETRSRPIASFSHNIIGRVEPFFSQVVEDCGGKLCYWWKGTSPSVIVRDPELIREILCDKSGHIDKVETVPTARYLVNGLANLRGRNWASRRKMINPAFHVVKLKVNLRGLGFDYFSCF